MLFTAKLLLVFVAIFVVANETVHASVLPSVCSIEDEAVQGCLCCKKTCWMRIAEMTTSFFGHMPGEKSDDEVVLALAMIRRCFSLECSPVCK